MKNLPKVYHNKLNKSFNNNNSVFYGKSSNEKNNTMDKKNIYQKINEIFSSPNYVYKANVEITLKDKKISKRIIGRNKDYIITMDNDLIPISEIMDIESTKKN